jgi:small multidrug resistance pump
MSYLALAVAIALGVTGQFLLKAGAAGGSFAEQILRPASVAGLGTYFLSAMLYMVALRQLPVSVAYPSVSASYVVVTLASALFLGEAVSLQQAVAIGLISLGVVLLYA